MYLIEQLKKNSLLTQIKINKDVTKEDIHQNINSPYLPKRAVYALFCIANCMQI